MLAVAEPGERASDRSRLGCQVTLLQCGERSYMEQRQEVSDTLVGTQLDCLVSRKSVVTGLSSQDVHAPEV